MFSHFHAYTPDEAACDTCGGRTYEILVNGRFVKVTAYIFRSWTGERKLDGELYEGPSYLLGTTTIAGEG